MSKHAMHAWWLCIDGNSHLCMWALPHIPLKPVLYSRDRPQDPGDGHPKKLITTPITYKDCSSFYNNMTPWLGIGLAMKCSCQMPCPGSPVLGRDMNLRSACQSYSFQQHHLFPSTEGDWELPGVVQCLEAHTHWMVCHMQTLRIVLKY